MALNDIQDDEIWLGWHSPRELLQRLRDDFERGDCACRFCGQQIEPDDNFDLYTTINCQVVCLDCAAMRAPEITAWTREFRRMRSLRHAVVPETTQ